MGSGSPTIKSVMPSCWADDIRMNMLFSAFRSQAVNPTGWQDKMNFWVNLITDYCHQTKTVSFTHEDLCVTFERQGCVPQCLRAVIDHMLSDGCITTLAVFNRNPLQKKSWLDWGYDMLLYRPAMWSLSTLQSAIQWNPKDERYVMISVVKDLASKVLARHKNMVSSQWTDNVVYLETLEEQCKDFCSGANLKMALTQLQKENEALLLELNGQWVVKFRMKGEPSATLLSDLDQGILRLQKAKDAVQKEVDRVDSEVNSCLQSAKLLSKDGHKTKAMLFLKRKKRFEKLLEKKVAVLDNIDSLLSQLQDSTSEKMVLQAYNSGVLAMKSAVKGGLDLDNIDTIMADVGEMLDTANEIQDTISKPVSSVDADLSELEEELDDLLAGDAKEGAAKSPAAAQPLDSLGEGKDLLNKLINLPSPPANLSPVSQSKAGVSSKTSPRQVASLH